MAATIAYEFSKVQDFMVASFTTTAATGLENKACIYFVYWVCTLLFQAFEFRKDEDDSSTTNWQQQLPCFHPLTSVVLWCKKKHPIACRWYISCYYWDHSCRPHLPAGQLLKVNFEVLPKYLINLLCTIAETLCNQTVSTVKMLLSTFNLINIFAPFFSQDGFLF